MSWLLAEDLDDVKLEAPLFPLPPAIAADQRRYTGPGCMACAPSQSTLALLWAEHRASAPDGFGYFWCWPFPGLGGRLKPTMRQTHMTGERLFVDFAGRTGEVVDGLTGEIIPVQIFVVVLGASSFTYAEAVDEIHLYKRGTPFVDALPEP